MFEATFLGHVGWLIESGGTRVLVDPLLTDRLTNTLGDPIALYPPRRIDLASFPPIDGVIVSHEHPDHLNIPTLLRLDRSTRIFLPDTASVAAYGLVRELGFESTALHSGQSVPFGELVIHPYHSAEITLEEWDVVPFVITNRAGDGSLATSIDAPEVPAFARFAMEKAGRVGVWVTSHNRMDLSALNDWQRHQRDDELTAREARDFRERFETAFRGLQRPEVMAVLGGGFTFVEDAAWMNRHVFPAHASRCAALLTVMMRGTPEVKVRAPLPGHRFSFKEGRLVDEVASRPFFATREPAVWPPHAAEPMAVPPPDYPPACGRRELSEADLEALLVELRSYAGHLYGGDMMRSLYEVGGETRLPRPQAACFSLRTDKGPIVLAWRPRACAFERVECDDARREFTAGMECWASDLLAVLRLQVNAGYVLLGRCRKWNAAPDRLRFDLDGELPMYTHPLRMPERAMAQYRAAVAALAPAVGADRIPARPRLEPGA